jgi:WD40 repeat protein
MKPSSFGALRSIRFHQEKFPPPPKTSVASFSPDGNWFCLQSTREVTVWETRALRQVGRQIAAPDAEVVQVGLGGPRVYLGSASGDIRTFDVASGREGDALTAHRQRVTALTLTKDGRFLASAGLDQTLQVRELGSGKLRADVRFPADRIQTLSFSPDGWLLAGSSTPDDRIIVWDLRHQSAPLVLAGHKGLIPGMNFSPDGRILASARMALRGCGTVLPVG